MSSKTGTELFKGRKGKLELRSVVKTDDADQSGAPAELPEAGEDVAEKASAVPTAPVAPAPAPQPVVPPLAPPKTHKPKKTPQPAAPAAEDTPPVPETNVGKRRRG